MAVFATHLSVYAGQGRFEHRPDELMQISQQSSESMSTARFSRARSLQNIETSDNFDQKIHDRRTLLDGSSTITEPTATQRSASGGAFVQQGSPEHHGVSDACRHFGYSRYIQVKSLKDFTAWGHKAQPGDMIELTAGTYTWGDGKTNPFNPGQGYDVNNGDSGGHKDAPTMATDGTIFKVSGTTELPIVFCGDQQKTIIDGADSEKYWTYGVRIVQASNIRFSGFTLRNALKGLDIQGTTNSKFSYITTYNTLQEGIRIRYNSQWNTVYSSHVMSTGLLYVGVGEGVYIGTSHKNSIDDGLPSDHSDHNTIRDSVFGPGVTAESIDVKEFTSFGNIINNTFDGGDLSGQNGAQSCIVIKGNKWSAVNNTCSNLRSGFVGYRITLQAPGQGSFNTVNDNTCQDAQSGSFCVYMDPGVRGNKIGCANHLSSSSRQDGIQGKLCNCQPAQCAKKRRRDVVLGGSSTPFKVVGPSYTVPSIGSAEEDPRPSWD